jgi:hypothetical protein
MRLVVGLCLQQVFCVLCQSSQRLKCPPNVAQKLRSLALLLATLLENVMAQSIAQRLVKLSSLQASGAMLSVSKCSACALFTVAILSPVVQLPPP